MLSLSYRLLELPKPLPKPSLQPINVKLCIALTAPQELNNFCLWSGNGPCLPHIHRPQETGHHHQQDLSQSFIAFHHKPSNWHLGKSTGDVQGVTPAPSSPGKARWRMSVCLSVCPCICTGRRQ